jgi:hypothetical protein
MEIDLGGSDAGLFEYPGNPLDEMNKNRNTLSR